jgi:TrmH family RNA methyltransferase
MKVSRLASKDNPWLKKIRSIASRARGIPPELVLAEGTRVLEEVLRSGCIVEAAVFSDSFGSSARERSLLEAWSRRNIRLFRVPDAIFASLSDVRTPQGALAVVHVPEPSLDEIAPGPDPLILYACGIQDPGNLGTLIRAAAAAGATMVCTSKGTVSARNPKAIRSSAGAFFHIPLVENTDPGDFLAYCRRWSIRLFRSDPRSGIPYDRQELRAPCAILLGSEGAGVVEKEFASCPAIRIPMAEGVESLNVAMAGAIILFEALRQRSNPQEPVRRPG